MDTNVAKVITLVALIVITIVLGFVPIWLVQRGTLTTTGSSRRKRILDFLNCFAGGVFLGTCLLHLLAEGREEFEDYLNKVNFEIDYPLYETITAAGLFIVALVERVGFALMTFHGKSPSLESSDDSGCGSVKKSTSSSMKKSTSASPLLDSALEQETSVGKRGTYGTQDEVQFRGGSSDKQENHGASNGHSTGASNGLSKDNHDCEDDAERNGECDGQATRPSDKPANGFTRQTSVRFSNSKEELSASVEFRPDRDVMTQNGTYTYHGDSGHHSHHGRPSFSRSTSHDHHHHHQSLIASQSCEAPAISQVSVVRAFLLLIALSFHTVFDGLAVGLQETVDSVWEVFAAIAIHKALVAFCLGLELVSASPDKPKRPYLLIIFFSLISPIGIAIGIGVTSGHVDALAKSLTSSVLQGIATGTFLYVTFFEILGQQFAHSHEQNGGQCWEVMKVIVTACGFAAMAGVKVLDTD